ncbi:MAG: hypothetical protein AABZ39_20580 [Spirochaetota bacterium]
MDTENASCPLCSGTKRLSQKGIAVIYLLPHIVWVCIAVISLILGIVHNRYWLILTAGAYIAPLVRADLRLLLYPFTAIASVLGAKVNCPKCEPHGGVFRKY